MFFSKFKEYQDTLDGRMKEILSQGIESGKSSQNIVKELIASGAVEPADIKKQEKIKNRLAKNKIVSKTEEKTSDTIDKLTAVMSIAGEAQTAQLMEIAQAIDKNKLEIVTVQDYLDLMVDVQKEGNQVAVDRENTDKKRFELEKQVEQNTQLRHLDLMDANKDKDKDSGGVFGGLLGGFKGFKGALGKATPLIKGLGKAGLVAGTAFLAFEAGGKISDWIDKATEKITGEEGATAGGND